MFDFTQFPGPLVFNPDEGDNKRIFVDDVEHKIEKGEFKSLRLGPDKNVAALLSLKGFGSLWVDGRQWQSWYEGMKMFAVGPGLILSAPVKVGEKWTYVINEKPVQESFDDVSVWTIKADGTMLAAAVGDEGPDGKVRYRVIVRQIDMLK